jgi:hypothetical protein
MSITNHWPFKDDSVSLLADSEPVPTPQPTRVFGPHEKQKAISDAHTVVPEASKYFLGGSAGLGLKAADIDVFMLVPDLDAVAERLSGYGFTYLRFHAYDDKGFIPLRKGDLNIIAMDDERDFDQTEIAYKVCQYLVSEGIHPTKEQRKVIHRILRGEPTSFVTP